MDLKDFIANSLTQIAEGILTANEALSCTDAQVNPVQFITHSNTAQGYGRLLLPTDAERGRVVERVSFDVAVTAENSEAGRGGLKVGIASFGINGGVESTDKAGSTSRIQFGVPMVFPSKRNDK